MFYCNIAMFLHVCMCITTFTLQHQSWIVATQTLGRVSLNIYSVYLLGKVFQYWIKWSKFFFQLYTFITQEDSDRKKNLGLPAKYENNFKLFSFLSWNFSKLQSHPSSFKYRVTTSDNPIEWRQSDKPNGSHIFSSLSIFLILQYCPQIIRDVG